MPELADLRALPAPHRGVRTFGWSRMGQAILNGPAADLGAIQLEGVQAEGFRGSEAVRARRGAAQTFYEEVSDWFGPGDGMVATRGSRAPLIRFLLGSGQKVIGGERIETAPRQTELIGGLGCGQSLVLERSQDMANEGRSVAVRELLVLFKSRE